MSNPKINDFLLEIEYTQLTNRFNLESSKANLYEIRNYIHAIHKIQKFNLFLFPYRFVCSVMKVLFYAQMARSSSFT